MVPYGWGLCVSLVKGSYCSGMVVATLLKSMVVTELRR